MIRRHLLIGLVALAAASGSACGGGSGSAASPPPVAAGIAVKALDTAQLLLQARQPSDTGSPFVVNGGALIFTDTSDTTEPVSISGP